VRSEPERGQRERQLRDRRQLLDDPCLDRRVLAELVAKVAPRRRPDVLAGVVAERILRRVDERLYEELGRFHRLSPRPRSKGPRHWSDLRRSRSQAGANPRRSWLSAYRQRVEQLRRSLLVRLPDAAPFVELVAAAFAPSRGNSRPVAGSRRCCAMTFRPCSWAAVLLTFVRFAMTSPRRVGRECSCPSRPPGRARTAERARRRMAPRTDRELEHPTAGPTAARGCDPRRRRGAGANIRSIIGSRPAVATLSRSRRRRRGCDIRTLSDGSIDAGRRCDSRCHRLCPSGGGSSRLEARTAASSSPARDGRGDEIRELLERPVDELGDRRLVQRLPGEAEVVEPEPVSDRGLDDVDEVRGELAPSGWGSGPTGRRGSQSVARLTRRPARASLATTAPIASGRRGESATRTTAPT
jgi:hypothetical protein